MPTFAITLIDRHGQRASVRRDASSLGDLRTQLRAESLWPIRIAPVQSERRLARTRLRPRDLIALLHQLELQVRAGVTADAALAQLAADLPHGAARRMLEYIHRKVAHGSPIHAACRSFTKVFPAQFAAVIEAGESSAQLPEALRALAAHLTASEDLQRTARRALVYPTVVLVATTALIVFLLGGVVPRFAEIFSSIHVPLPALTVALIASSEWLRGHWPVATAATICLGSCLLIIARTARLRYARDWALLHVPVLGDTLRCLATARFAAHTRLMQEAGLPIQATLTTAAELSGHAVLAGDLLRARHALAEGKPLCDALPKNHSFPGFVVPALRAGETTGQLAAALRHIEDYAATRAREQLATALALLEPVILTALTTIVGAIALSFFLPLFALLGGVNGH